MNNNNSMANQEKILKPWGYEIILTEKNSPYVGKIIHINKGKRLSLQYHDLKEETQCLISGKCFRYFEDDSGNVLKEEMKNKFGYKNPAGKKHRLEAITDCDIVEFSTPEIGKTFRLEDDYGRTDETEDTRSLPNRGWEAN